MPVQKYANYIETNQLFESVVDIDADRRNPDLWREYIVGEDMQRLVDVLCQSLGNEAPDVRRSFWMQGSYGTGKSYAAIFVKHLLEEAPAVVDEYLARSNKLSQYRSRFMKCRDHGDYLVIWKTGCVGMRSGDMMLLEAEKAVREALLQKFGKEAVLGTKSLQQAVISKLNDESINWDYLLETTTLGDDYASADELRNLVKNGDLTAIQRIASVIRQRGWGLVDSLDTFKAWIAEIIDENHLSKSGIFFIWDEFTEYFDHTDDHTVMQQISEFCKVKPFFMLYVIHRVQREKDSVEEQHYQRITERFHTVDFHISTDTSFDLIENSFGPKLNMGQHWEEARRRVVQGIRPFLPDMTGLDDKISERIEHLCPMHPMTIKLLSRVSESYAAAQRTLFRFMKDQTLEDQGFSGYIAKYGPEDQACWLTPEWLWDYFFTRDSDFRDKDTKAAEFIRHFEENRRLVENDENTYRVFKIAMLLLAVMSSVKGVDRIIYRQGAISATVECLENCLAGTMSKELIRDKLNILEDDRLLNRDEYGGVTRLQLPYRALSGDAFTEKLKENDKKYTRYQMFGKDGQFSTQLEERAKDESDVMDRRLKIAACCAETLSIQNRMEEIEKELEKAPYKLGLLLVAVKDDTQAMAVQSDLQKRAQAGGERMMIALLREALTDEKRKEWLTRLTHYELATDSGATVSANQHKSDMNQTMATWVGKAIEGRITAWHGTQVFNNLYGKAQLRKIMETQVLQTLFPYAPETIVSTYTVYKSCNDSAPLAGIQRDTKSAQFRSVLNGLQKAGVLNLTAMDELTHQEGNKEAKAVAAVARLIQEKMDTGKLSLDDLWEQLQRPPFGYYDTIACGILLGFVFSFYQNSAFSWIDSAQAPHVLAEATLKTLVFQLCKGKMTTDYLSSGSVVFRNFREYAKAIFALEDVQVATETECWRNMREVITKSGAPLWTLKYLDDEAYINPALQDTAMDVTDAFQDFVLQEGDREPMMSKIQQLMTGRGKVKNIMRDALKDKAVLAAAFRKFLFGASPALADIAGKLHLQPEILSDKLHQVMQAAIYTWMEDQVRDKLGTVVREYQYLDTLNAVIGKNFHGVEEAQKELKNIFDFFRISMDAAEQLNLPWFGALRILHRVSREGILHTAAEQQTEEMAELKVNGNEAMSMLRDARPLLHQMLEKQGFECTKEELDSVYQGLREMDCDASIGQFNNALKQQTNQISQARNRILLRDLWIRLTGVETVKEWCMKHRAPIQWIVPQRYSKAIETVADVQRDRRVMDQYVQGALGMLEQMDIGLLTNDSKIEDAFIHTIGEEYRAVWQAEKDMLMSRARQKNGSDLYTWGFQELTEFRQILKEAQKEKAKREKMTLAQHAVKRMNEAKLRNRVAQFLDQHPEYCDDFME